MAITINAKGTSTNSFKIGKNGITIPGTGASPGTVLLIDQNGDASWNVVYQKYDIGFAIMQIPNNPNTTILMMVLPRTISLEASNPGIAVAETPSTTDVTFDIVIDDGTNETTVGTITFLANQKTGTVSLNSNLTLNNGDIFKIKTQNTVTNDLLNIAITFPGLIQ